MKSNYWIISLKKIHCKIKYTKLMSYYIRFIFRALMTSTRPEDRVQNIYQKSPSDAAITITSNNAGGLSDPTSSTQTLDSDMTVDCSSKDNDPDSVNNKRLATMFMLGVAYSSNLGGTGFPTGTGPNLVLWGILQGWDCNWICWILKHREL